MIEDKLFLKIAVTREDFFPEESAKIVQLLDSGEVDLVHIRKPGASDEETAALIAQIPEKMYGKLKLHQNYSLLSLFNLGGIHLKSGSGVGTWRAMSEISKSLHSLEELSEATNYDYVTLSPIYDSISKKGYKAAFDFSELREKLKEVKNVIALGGVTPDKFPELASLGFRGAALLGHYW